MTVWLLKYTYDYGGRNVTVTTVYKSIGQLIDDVKQMIADGTHEDDLEIEQSYMVSDDPLRI